MTKKAELEIKITSLEETVSELCEVIERVVARADAAFDTAHEALALAQGTAQELETHAEQGCWSVSSN